MRSRRTSQMVRRTLLLLLSGFLASGVPALSDEGSAAGRNSGYGQFELLPVEASGPSIHPTVLAKFRDSFEQQVGPTLAAWNAAARDSGRSGSLGIRVTITDMRFVTTARRFWIGPLAGSSRAAGTVSLVDLDSGKILASDSFDAASGAWAGAVTVGALDNRMIRTLASRMASYVNGCTAICFGESNPPSARSPGDVDPVVDGGAVEESRESDLYRELNELDELRRKGILSEAEFQAEKREVLKRHHESP